MANFPATTEQQARALVAALPAVDVDGFHLEAQVVNAGEGRAVVNGRWAVVPAIEVHLVGGRWGTHVLRCSVSSPERIRAHWEGYVAAHVQHAARKAELRSVPAGKVYVPKTSWQPKPGDRCFFERGMFGTWRGTIKRLYQARKSSHTKWGPVAKGEWLADIAATGANGNVYMYERVPARTLTRNGIHPTIEEA